ncbi:MAG: ATP-binding cassette domain-containing protein [Bacteroidetes bacterium]|nr:ATP-binding cassette domain-containing protein [Bacteroidota bacterium]
MSAKKAHSDLTRELKELSNRNSSSAPFPFSEGIRGVFLSKSQATTKEDARTQEGFHEAIQVLEKSLAELGENLPLEDYDVLMKKSVEVSARQVELSEAISVLENVMMAPYLAGLPQHADYAKEVLNRLGVGSLARAMPDEISAGQAQRVSIARAVVNAPAVLLADEPTSALDDDHCEEVLDLLFEQAHANDSTLVVVTHDARVARRFSNRLHFAELGSLPTIHQEA